ncbi:MAG: GDP-mannose 4,6-dehydratase [Patescibacteria group bacterium]
MKYLISGGCGFIGVNFALKLLELGQQLIIVDNLSRRGSRNNLALLKSLSSDIEFFELDIARDNQILARLVERVEVVFHLAGQVAVTSSIQDPRNDFQANLLGTFNILEACRLAKKPPILIYASTNKVYGGMEQIKIVKKRNRYQYRDLPTGITENEPLDFHSPYGCSKGAADQYVRDYARIYGMRTVVMRQSCIYGPHQYGVEDQGWVAWFAIAAMLKKQITIYGDGMQVRDLLHVDDLFDAWMTAVARIDSCKGEIFNVGGGAANALSLLELIAKLESKLSLKLKPNFAEWREGDQPVYISDITKIRKELGWKPKIEVEQGLDSLLEWIAKNRLAA